jgi:rifampicin phosphotransferase
MTTQKTSKKLASLDAPLAGDVAASGGKSVGLHRMLVAGLPVPPGFVVTTAAFDAVIGGDEKVRASIEKLNDCAPGMPLREGAIAVREAILACELPEEFAREIIEAWESITKNAPVAVRSSATAEDLANASFAGQQDTYLSIETRRELLDAVRRCWASLYTERAVVYRRTHGFDKAHVSMAVVIQQMIQAESAGVLFTADPLSGHRGISVVEAVAGLGEALVSGHVTPERYRIRNKDSWVLERRGTQGQTLGVDGGLLPDSALAQLNALGQKSAAHNGMPMDIEWAFAKNKIWLLQARPITTLWPLPEGKPLEPWRVYVSLGHIQVYTAPFSYVGISMFARIIPLARDENTGLSKLIHRIGDRIYVDFTPALSRQPFRTLLPIFLMNASEQIAKRLQVAAKREEMDSVPEASRARVGRALPILLRLLAQGVKNIRSEPNTVRDIYIEKLESIAKLQGERMKKAETLEQRLDTMFEDLGQILVDLVQEVVPRLLPAMMLAKFVPRLAAWLDPEIDSRLLLQGLEGNITTEMDMSLADIGDVARDIPQIVAALKDSDPIPQLETLRKDPDCKAFFQVWDKFLEENGHRGVGEIDPGTPRWREDSRLPLRSVAGALERPRGALRAQHHALTKQAEECRDKLVEAARKKPFGSVLASFTKGAINRMRILLAAREHHKFYMVKTIDRLRTVTLEAGQFLHSAGVIESADDIWFLELNEIREAVKKAQSARKDSLHALIVKRRALRERYANMNPPAVMTSEGEAIQYVDDRVIPPNSLAGTSVSGGIYEGTARVVFDPAREELGAGEVLVARFTDPGWTPLFGHAGALVMEVGGQMTHGSVIAREIGIPAVVAVEGATARIRSGDRIRVDGEGGFVTILGGAT